MLTRVALDAGQPDEASKPMTTGITSAIRSLSQPPVFMTALLFLLADDFMLVFMQTTRRFRGDDLDRGQRAKVL